MVHHTLPFTRTVAILLLLTLTFTSHAASATTTDPQPGAVAELNDANFDEILEGREVVVMFYAPWCGVCTQFKPTYHEWATKLAQEDSGISNVLVAKLDSTLNPDVSSAKHIQSYPSIKFFRDKILISDFAGERSIAGLTKWVKEHSKQAALAGHKPAQKKDTTTPSPTATKSGTEKEKTKSTGRLTDSFGSLLPDLTNLDLTDPQAVKQLLYDLLEVPLSLFIDRPYMAMACCWALGLFQGLFFGVIWALREKR